MRTWLMCLVVCCGSIAIVAESAAGITWTAPAGWTSQRARPMRAATYAIAPVAGDKSETECAVYFFGAGQGGSADANITRWKEQFTLANGAPAAAKVAKRVVQGLPVTTIDVSGNYSGLGGPLAASASVSDYRLLGAIVEAPGGNIFVKCTGPMKTIAGNQPKFEQLLASMRPAR